VQPNLAESWEQSPDGLTFTLNLRQNANFTAPLSRRVTSADVMYSFNRVLGRDGIEPAPEAGQLAMIDTYEAPDENTFVIHLKQPFGRFANRIADVFTINIVPEESGPGGSLDITQPDQIVGWGPFMLESFDPEAETRYVRNPDWWGGPDRPWIDALVNTTVPDPNTTLVQFQAGNLDQGGTISPDKIPEIGAGATQVSGAVWQGDQTYYLNKSLGWGFLAFGSPSPWRGDGESPWGDDRVRKAISLGLDRDALLEVVYNIGPIESAGFQIADRLTWHNILPGGFPGQSVDPRTDAATGTWIKYDPAEAMKLLQAAGAEGFSAEYHYSTIYGAGWTKEAELIPQLLKESIGIDLQTHVDDYASEYVTGTFLGKFNGLAFVLKAFPDLTEYFSGYDPGSTDNHSQVNDADIKARLDGIQAILGTEERNAAVMEVQAELVEHMYYVPGVNWQITWGARQNDTQNTGLFLLGRGGGGFVEEPWIFFDPART
jgi:peptide/nickel transport system substrate-binding protein